jgi:hypothetical protein
VRNARAPFHPQPALDIHRDGTRENDVGESERAVSARAREGSLVKHVAGGLIVALLAAVLMLARVGESRYFGDLMPLFFLCMAGSLMLLAHRR